MSHSIRPPKNPVLVFPKGAKPRRRSKAEWLEKFAAVPTKPAASAEESAKQRALFERHDAAAVSLRVPMPPSRHAYMNLFQPPRGRARLIISSAGRAYKDAVAKCWRDANKGWTPDPLTGPVRLLVVLRMATRRSSDLDNRMKALQDAIVEAGIIADDSLIDHLGVLRGPVDPSGKGYCDLIIETICE